MIKFKQFLFEFLIKAIYEYEVLYQFKIKYL